MAKVPKPDLFTFVAEIALQSGQPVPITCNCGGVITIIPPMQEDLVVCRGESRIKINVLSGDPGYVMGMSPNGEPMLIPVQGSSKEKLESATDTPAASLWMNPPIWAKRSIRSTLLSVMPCLPLISGKLCRQLQLLDSIREPFPRLQPLDAGLGNLRDYALLHQPARHPL